MNYIYLYVGGETYAQYCRYRVLTNRIRWYICMIALGQLHDVMYLFGMLSAPKRVEIYFYFRSPHSLILY